MTVGVGDDLVMRLSVHSIENLRTKVIQTIHATKLPKVSRIRPKSVEKHRLIWQLVLMEALLVLSNVPT